MGGRAARAVAFAAVVATAAWLATSAGASPGAARRRPAAQRLNFVFILSDDERVQGNAVMHDVNRLLAKHGVTFSNFDVTTSECGPSRASILTGQYSHHTGVMDNFGPHGYPAFAGTSDLANWLHRAGYETALVGKYLNDYSLDGHNAIPPGWDDWQAMDSVPLEKYYDYKVNENGRIVHYGSRPADYSTTVLTKQALAFLRTGAAAVLPLLRARRAAPARRSRRRRTSASSTACPRSDRPPLNQAEHLVRAVGLVPLALADPGRHRATPTDVRRHQLESLLSLDRVGEADRRHARQASRARPDGDRLHERQRLPLGRAPARRQALALPRLDPRAADRADAVDDGERHVQQRARPEHRLRLDDQPSSPGSSPGCPQDGESFAPMLRGKTIPWRKDYLVEYLGKNKLRVGGPPPYVAIRTPPLPLRPVPLPRLAGALRPPPRPVGAPQRRRRHALRSSSCGGCDACCTTCTSSRRTVTSPDAC